MGEHTTESVPIYTLKGLAATVVPTSLAITVTSMVIPDGRAVRLDLIEGGTVLPASRPRPGMLMVPPRTGRLTIRVCPVDDQRFPAGTQIELSLAVGHPRQQDAVVVRLARTDISGLPFRDLVMLESHGADRAISATLGAIERELAPLGEFARVTARECLGTGALAPGLLTTAIAVDVSASMLSLRPGDSVGAVIDLLDGVASVISPDKAPEIAAVGRERVVLRDISLREWGTHCAEGIRGLPMSSGLLSARSTPTANTVAGELTFLITDAVPPDSPGPADPANPALHLVILSSRSAWRVMEGTTSQAATLIELPGQAASLKNALLAAPGPVRDIVGSLLRSLPTVAMS